MYDRFCTEQAAIQDDIRNLWTQLAHLHGEVVPLDQEDV